ncbi:MAG: hypothetical protein ACOC0Z_02150 [Halohasta sp.]
MNRRTYLSLGASGVLLGLAGCTGGEDTGESGQEYPPYPDSESTDFSGEGNTVTDSFELSAGGPMILDVQHEGDERFVAFATEDEDGEDFVQGGPTVQAVGPYRGLSIYDLPEATYWLSIEASGEWTATVYDLPVYDDGTGISLPIEREGALGDVIGPIDFGELGDREFSIEFETAEGLNWVDLLDREGETVVTLFEGDNTLGGGGEDGAENESTNGTNTTTNDSDSTSDQSENETNETDEETDSAETEATETIEVSGVGYLSIESGGEWTLSFTDAD